jgi:hypothetical protein
MAAWFSSFGVPPRGVSLCKLFVCREMVTMVRQKTANKGFIAKIVFLKDLEVKDETPASAGVFS